MLSWPTLAEIWGTEPYAFPGLGPRPLFGLGPLTFPIFKATKACWADQFFCDGSIRIGTVWDFRRGDYGERIGDMTEGLRPLAFPDPIEGVMIAAPMNVRDSYVFCMSADCDIQRFVNDGYDAVYRIEGPDFFHEISVAIAANLDLSMAILMPMAYANEQELIDFTIDQRRLGHSIKGAVPWVGGLKPDVYPYPDQREIRAVFEPAVDVNAAIYPDLSRGVSPAMVWDWASLSSALKPLDIKVPAARQYAQREY